MAFFCNLVSEILKNELYGNKRQKKHSRTHWRVRVSGIERATDKDVNAKEQIMQMLDEQLNSNRKSIVSLPCP